MFDPAYVHHTLVESECPSAICHTPVVSFGWGPGPVALQVDEMKDHKLPVCGSVLVYRIFERVCRSVISEK